MSIKLVSHLHRNRCGVFGFRIVVPRDLRTYFQSIEYRLSLHTSDLRTAKQFAARLGVLLWDRFDRLRRMKKDAQAIDAAKILQDIDSERHRLGKSMLVNAGAISEEEQSKFIADMIGSMPDSPVKALGNALLALSEKERELNEAQRALILRALEEAPNEDAQVDSFFVDLYEEAGKLKNREASLVIEFEQYRSLIRQIDSELQAGDALDQAEENFATERERLAEFASQIIARTPHAEPSPNGLGALTEVRTSATEVSLSQAVTAYCEDQLAAKQWTAKTAEEYKGVFDQWIRIVGDMPIRSYGFDQHRDYKRKLLKLPPNVNKTPRFRGLSIDQIIALQEPPAAPNTINKALTRASALFRWAANNGYSTFNPGTGMNIRNPKRANEERKAFDREDLAKLFGTAEYIKATFPKPYMYWVPLIALYTGARINEIAQLHVADFREIEEIPVISIDDEGDEKRLKTGAAKRLIPVHPELIRLGLLKYVEQLRQKKAIRLFMELQPRRDGFGQTVSKWFGRYRERCGVKEEGKVFHSFRHTVIDGLKQAGEQKEKIAALVGHEDDSVTFGRYGKDYQPRILLEVVSKLPSDATASIPPYRARRST